MDLLGDVVERDTGSGSSDDECAEFAPRNSSGFPELYKPKEVSSWKQRLKAKKACRPESKRSEAQSIHEENIKSLQNMSQEEIARERKELLESLDPKLVKRLLSNINRRAAKSGGGPLFAEIEGASGTWVGETDRLTELPALDDEQVAKALGISPRDDESLEQDIPDDEDVAPLDFQIAQSIDHMANEELLKDVHFVTRRNSEADQKIALNDPDFDQKLHEKFFPDLPRDVDKLQWMQPVPDAQPCTVIDDVSQCRFDFDGNLVPPTREITSTTHSALHHHADDPHLAGYTIPELQRLSRSTYPAQRAIAVQTLGRILYKLGRQAYYQLVPEVDLETYQQDGGTQKVTEKIYGLFWDLCYEFRIIECLQDASDEKKTKHLSTRNYALDALWLWKRGGGDFRKNEK
ncbi:hypothetical protein HG536_0B00360 [Torulaspora globosa]|uniref:RNA polymerase II-associated protein RBA50 n=1 Tax=Torulaspora globosa TaxID=48254 RepID=A0A7G3ZCD9_9SACH|nr:uncharacterized protein HG536_0B00360 [Torulaspora globosa]QLL31175.1 hypothetical protein HG536_0B00360 [Torulaspora globosa]